MAALIAQHPVGDGAARASMKIANRQSFAQIQEEKNMWPQYTPTLREVDPARERILGRMRGPDRPRLELAERRDSHGRVHLAGLVLDRDRVRGALRSLALLEAVAPDARIERELVVGRPAR